MFEGLADYVFNKTLDGTVIQYVCSVFMYCFSMFVYALCKLNYICDLFFYYFLFCIIWKFKDYILAGVN